MLKTHEVVELPTDPQEPVAVKKARSESDRQVNRVMVERARVAFEDWLQMAASPTDLYLVTEAFECAEGAREPLADSFRRIVPASITGAEANEANTCEGKERSSPETIRELRERTRGVATLEERLTRTAEFLTPEFLKSVGEWNRARLVVCALMLNEDRGCTTPIESFLGEFLTNCFFAAPTANAIKDMVNRLEEDLVDALDVARKMAAEYPEEMRKPA